jgi:hypothetical protein
VRLDHSSGGLDRNLLFFNRLDDGFKKIYMKEEDKIMLEIYTNSEAYKGMKHFY